MKKKRSKRDLSRLLTLAMAFTMLPVSALAANHPADTYSNRPMNLIELQDYMRDGLKVDKATDTITWPGLKEVTYVSGDKQNEITGVEVYLTQGTVPNPNDPPKTIPIALSGIQLRLDVTTVALYTLGQQTTFSEELTYSGISQKGWDNYNKSETTSVLIEVEISGGFICTIRADGFSLGAKEDWVNPNPTFDVRITLPTNSHMEAQSGSLTQTGVGADKPFENIVLVGEAGYTLTAETVTDINKVLADTGLTAKLNNNGTIAISGTPTKDVSGVTLPAAAPATVAEVYVKSAAYGGSNDNGDGTKETPYATIDYAYSRMAAPSM